MTPSRVTTPLAHADLVYHRGIAHVVATWCRPTHYPRQVFIGRYGDSELLARGLLVAGVVVHIKHCDHAGDVLHFEHEWAEGPGAWRAADKRPPSSAFYQGRMG